MTVLLAGDFEGTERHDWLALLRGALPGETIVDGDDPQFDRGAVEVALVANPRPGALLGLPKLALIHSLWAGVERLLANPDLPPGVPIVRMADPLMNAAMAETALWAVLALHRGWFAYAERQRRGEWRVHRQRRADEVTVAVLGLGKMGRAAAARIAALGYHVVGWSRVVGAALQGVEMHAGADTLPQVLGQAEIVVNLLPLTGETRGLFDARRLALLPPRASLVNLARGAHVVDDDLLAALDAGRLRHAVLDVFSVEPLPAGHRYWTHPRVTVLPHVAARTDPRSAVQVVAANLRAWRAGAPIAPLVDRVLGY